VAVLDEQQEAGGQVYRAVPREFALAETSRTPDHRPAMPSARSSRRPGRVSFGQRVWLAEPASR
jgi:hypothetical protein